MSAVKKIAALALVLALTSLAAPVVAAPDRSGELKRVPCFDFENAAHRINVRVDGKDAYGHFAVPATETPKDLVVFAHGYGHSSYSWVKHMERVARELEVIAITMDNRGIQLSPDTSGDGLPESRGWNVMTGAEDSIAAALLFEKSCPSIEKITIMGVSMGGNTSGLAVALAGARNVTRSDGSPLFDYWLNIEGATNMPEIYMGARGLAPVNAYAAGAVADIEKECGGSITSNPEAYQERSVVARIGDVAAAGLDGVVMVHGVEDGLVPYTQSREMATSLASEGISTDLFSVASKDEDSEKETTISSYITDNVDKSFKSPLAGHASEKSTTHIVMQTAFERLAAVVGEGTDVPNGYREFLVDGQVGTFQLI